MKFCSRFRWFFMKSICNTNERQFHGKISLLQSAECVKTRNSLHCATVARRGGLTSTFFHSWNLPNSSSLMHGVIQNCAFWKNPLVDLWGTNIYMANFWPILTKFGEQIKTSIIINNIKKYFKIFHFMAKFFPWSAHGQPLEKFFFAKKFIFVHIFILDVHIYCQNVHLGFRNSI